MEEISLDFETFSESDIKEVGGAVYSEHESTELLSVAFKINGGETILWHPDLPTEILQPLFDAIERGALFWAYNVFFERMIWENVCVAKMGWPEVDPKKYRCTATLSASYAIPRPLGKAGVALHLPVVKDSEGSRVMLKLSKPRKPSKHNPATRWTKEAVPDDYETLYQYNITDVDAEHAIKEMLVGLTKAERMIWQVDQKINSRGLAFDVDFIQKAIDLAEEKIDRLNRELTSLTKGAVEKATNVAGLKKWVIEQGVETDSLDKDAVEAILEKPDLDEAVERALRIRQSVGKSSVKKYKKMKMCLCKDGRIRDTHLYHAASTGRWGGKFIQTQNFARGSLKNPSLCIDLIKNGCSVDELDMYYEDTMVALSSCLRGAIISPEEKDLLVADYASIEARVLFWLANDLESIKILESGDDIYKHMASAIYMVPVDKVTKDQRQLGKQAILGCGYGMGATKFQETCFGYGIDIDDETAEEVVSKYRAKYEKVKKLWYATENAAVKAVRTKKVVHQGKVTWFMKGKFLHCILPSGRSIKYCEPKLRKVMTPWGAEKDQIYFMNYDSSTSRWFQDTTYSGKLVENITQAIARDLLAYALVRCDRHEFYNQIVMHTHDEMVVEVPEGEGSVEEFEKIISILPKWGKGIPVEAEGFRCKRYKK